ncbi:MAG: hypothetical protein ACF788_09160, partial [Novipirellula sp. JB048]
MALASLKPHAVDFDAMPKQELERRIKARLRHPIEINANPGFELPRIGSLHISTPREMAATVPRSLIH